MSDQKAAGGPIDNRDIDDWKNRFNNTMANTEKFSAPSPPDARPWSTGFFSCFAPVDLCLITCCVPCVTFGKTHHRTRKNGNMEGYEPINTSCLAFWASTCFGLHWVLQSMQMQDIREKYNLEGSCLVDIAKSCCCGCCALIQAEKESELREKEKGVVSNQYANGEQMVAQPH